MCGFADATNTGPAAAGFTNLTPYAGPYTITTDNTVISGKILNQPLLIRAKNVIIQGNRLAYGDPNWTVAITVVGSAAGTKILDNEIRGLSGTDWTQTPQRGIWVQTAGVEIRRNNIYWLSGDSLDIADGLPNQVITGNYVHDFTDRAGEHFDGIATDGGDVNLLIQNNTWLMWAPGHMTGTIGFANIHPGSYQGVTIDHNLLAGGGYTVWGGDISQYPDLNYKLTNNQFSTMYAPDSGAYGPVAYMPSFNTNGNVWSANTWADGPRAGQALAIP